MKAPEEMLELVKNSTHGPWKGIEKGNTVRSFAVVTVAYEGEPSENICSGITPKNGNSQFIAASREFVPYAAEWMIKAKELLWEARMQMSQNAIDLGDSGFFGDEDDTRKLFKEIDEFLGTTHETK